MLLIHWLEASIVVPNVTLLLLFGRTYEFQELLKLAK